MLLLIINYCYYCTEERFFFFREKWFGYIAVNGESPFFMEIAKRLFLFAKRDLNRYCFSSFKKNYTICVSKQDYVQKYDRD